MSYILPLTDIKQFSSIEIEKLEKYIDFTYTCHFYLNDIVQQSLFLIICNEAV